MSKNVGISRDAGGLEKAKKIIGSLWEQAGKIRRENKNFIDKNFLEFENMLQVSSLIIKAASLR